MGDLSDRIRKEKEEEMRRVAEEAQRKEQVNQQFQKREDELFQALDKIGVRRMLEDMKYDVWKGQGTITEAREQDRRIIRLSYEYPVPNDFRYTTRTRRFKGIGQVDHYSGGMGGSIDTEDVPAIIEVEEKIMVSVVSRYEATSITVSAISGLDVSKERAGVISVVDSVRQQAEAIAFPLSTTINYEELKGTVVDALYRIYQFRKNSNALPWQLRDKAEEEFAKYRRQIANQTPIEESRHVVKYLDRRYRNYRW